MTWVVAPHAVMRVFPYWTSPLWSSFTGPAMASAPSPRAAVNWGRQIRITGSLFSESFLWWSILSQVVLLVSSLFVPSTLPSVSPLGEHCPSPARPPVLHPSTTAPPGSPSYQARWFSENAQLPQKILVPALAMSLTSTMTLQTSRAFGHCFLLWKMRAIPFWPDGVGEIQTWPLVCFVTSSTLKMFVVSTDHLAHGPWPWGTVPSGVLQLAHTGSLESIVFISSRLLVHWPSHWPLEFGSSASIYTMKSDMH